MADADRSTLNTDELAMRLIELNGLARALDTRLANLAIDHYERDDHDTNVGISSALARLSQMALQYLQDRTP